jgi:perosamine synthetase
VHYAGQACDMDEILSIAQKHNLFVIEDAAHSFPSSYKGRSIGSISDAACFSFYATKTLTTGEGGMITTHREDWLERMRRLRLHGISADAWKRYSKGGSWKYDVIETGYKYNTTDIAAAIGIEQLKKTDLMLEKRRKIASIYDDAFNANDAVIPYKIKSDRESAHHLYPLRLNIEALKISRNEFIEKLSSLGVMTSVHFIPLYEFTAYKSNVNRAELFPSSKWVFERVLSLPIFVGMSDDDINYVVDCVLDALKKI